MKHTGRSLFGLATGAAALRAALPAAVPKIQAGKFTPDWDSLKQYRCPDWFRDAKLGIWSVWGPEYVPEQRDWYARNLHIEGHPQYKHHLETYGHPAKHGYKDIVPLWKGENWDPERLMSMYEKAGAKYFCGNENGAPFPAGWYPQNTPESFKQEYFRRLKGLVDNYQPDLLYSDGSVPFVGYGRSL